MFKLDTRDLEDEHREKLAWKVRNFSNINIPELSAWNYQLCRKHRSGWIEELPDGTKRTVLDRPKPLCTECPIFFRKHQRIGMTWLYLRKKALLADVPGLGKSAQVGGLLALLLETGEIPEDGRAVIIPRAPALHQWRDELLRMMPGLKVTIADGVRKKRVDNYLTDWHVMLVGPETFRNDFDLINKFKINLVVTDDIDQLRHEETQTSYYIDKMGMKAERYVIVTATPLQKKLLELYAQLDGIGGYNVFGRQETFEKNYIRFDWVIDNATGKRKRTQVGYKNLAVLKKKIAPMYLRRTTDDVAGDVSMPTIVPDDVMLELYPRQRAKYKELQQGVLKILKEEGAVTKQKIQALAKLTYGSQICDGLATLGEADDPLTSVKMDWIMENVRKGGSLGDEKVVVFSQYKNSIRALQDRFRKEGIGFETVWGEVTNKQKRRDSQKRFWTDPDCRIFLGTTSIEQSLNLQVARHLINMDMILNPARMEQLAGRIRRDGSAYPHVFVHNLLTVNTQEARIMPLLRREAALASHIWEENSQLFEALSATELLHLISG